MVSIFHIAFMVGKVKMQLVTYLMQHFHLRILNIQDTLSGDLQTKQN